MGMVTDEQVRRLRKLSNTEKNQEIAASKAGMDPTTARRYLGLGRLPSELKKERPWRTREDPFCEVWDAVQQQIQESPGLEAKTLFEWLQREYPGRFSDGQIRTLQRRIKLWRVTEGPAQEVYFGQKHMPGRLCASDFTHMTELGITLEGQTLEHLVYHFVLTYSTWETIVLDGKTDIKKGITYSRFETVPDAPISSFETSLPEGPHSILAANLPASAHHSMCGQSLSIPTIITAQNGKEVKQSTKLAVTGCKASKPSVKITKTKLKGNTLLVTVKTSANGTISISGNDFKTTTKKNVNAGTHAITVSLTKAGKTAKKHRKKSKLRASLTVGKQAAATTTSVKL